MNQLPAAFEARMRALLGADAGRFLEALRAPAPVSVRLNPAKVTPENLCLPAATAGKVPWAEYGYYLAERPLFTLDPCFHGGAYYVQEASSLFLEQILKQLLPDTPVRVLDLCAAPGGKSTLAADLLPAGSLLVANEVIRSRAAVLKENIVRWGRNDIAVSNSDPAAFARLERAFDLLIADAPCSGEGLFRKDPASIREWSESNLVLCSERQKRILADSWPALKAGGYLVYSTCTYNPEENERIIEWAARELGAEPVEIPHSFAGITPGESLFPTYRFYPHKTAGEGFFTGVLRKQGGESEAVRRGGGRRKKESPAPALPPEIKALLPDTAEVEVKKEAEVFRIVPAAHADFLEEAGKSIRMVYEGCEVAEVNGRKVKPLHSLALYASLNKTGIAVAGLSLPEALRFLKKEELSIPVRNGAWILLCYEGIALGWGKGVGNRLNNYFPKEWRIRMELPADLLLTQ
ncbi:MAG: RNA methyltransferase [Culturomica sp.]|jgi:16S rRNA C967 or C1407 C5-methylase (RsmB/RsmF family)/NOL1/NOP2/fmu family ribosome biogenesis protein|nr:RNA methyltransferase [Culturomica sp.]